MKLFSKLLLLSAFTALSAFSSKPPGNTYQVNINAAKIINTVSPNIMGFNMVYCFEPDAPWQSGAGKVAQLMKNIGVGQFRYPGGTVVTRYHWDKLTGQGWEDELDPKFDARKNLPPSAYMDVDEYLELTKRLKIDPLVGINMGSGVRFHRVRQGVDEAVRLMKHCLNKGVKVKYYYLDNEPYLPGANYMYRSDEYADMINTYASAMRKVDPGIKIIVNTHPNADMYIGTLLEKAGKNIDMVDVHMYWSHGRASFANWIKEPMMTHHENGTYAEQRKIWEDIFAGAGYPNIKLVVLEWNIGPTNNTTPPTTAQAALMAAEQFTQYIQSGLVMACFWPVSLPGNKGKNPRPIFHSENGNYVPNKSYEMFALYKDVLGQQQVASQPDNKRLITLVVKSHDGKTLWVYLLNKNQDEVSDVKISLSAFKAKSVEVAGFDSDGKDMNAERVKPAKINEDNYTLKMPKNALVKLTLKS